MKKPRLVSMLASMLLLASPSVPGIVPVAAADTPAGCTLRIHVDGLRNSVGNVGSVVYTSADGWPDDPKKAFRIGPAPITAGQRQATAVWDNLPAGDYGVAVIHDENSNAKLDKNFLGIPKEGFGFANNPHIGWGPAPFKEALVHVGCPVTEITVHMVYK